MKLEQEPKIISKTIDGNNKEVLFNQQSIKYIKVEKQKIRIMLVSSCFIEDGGQPSGPSSMMMHEAQHVHYNFITDCKLCCKKGV